MTRLSDPRAAYWDSTYRNYWKDRVAEAEQAGGSEVQKGDVKTEGDWVYECIFSDYPFIPGTILDVGCAWGRMFPIYRDRGLQMSGVDISSSMVDAARETYGQAPDVSQLELAAAENLPFPAACFDNLVCIAVFDATYQHQALSAFLRVLKPGGRLYLSGKGDRYPMDDELAFAAEKGARAKKHPNYFTDVQALLSVCYDAGCRVKGQYFFERRGYFADFKYKTQPDHPFYEWFLVLDTPHDGSKIEFEPFSSEYSQTFRERTFTG